MLIDKIQTWSVDRIKNMNKMFHFWGNAIPIVFRLLKLVAHNMFTLLVACSLRTVITFPPIVFAGPVELGRWYIIKSTLTENDMT